MGGESTGRQLLAQLEIVINFAVVGDPQARIARGHGLMSACYIDDTQPTMA